MGVVIIEAMALRRAEFPLMRSSFCYWCGDNVPNALNLSKFRAISKEEYARYAPEFPMKMPINAAM